MSHTRPGTQARQRRLATIAARTQRATDRRNACDQSDADWAAFQAGLLTLEQFDARDDLLDDLLNALLQDA